MPIWDIVFDAPHVASCQSSVQFFRVNAMPVSSTELQRRRTLLKAGVLSTFGLALPDLLESQKTVSAAEGGRAKSCILLYMIGGPPQHETFDMKPEGDTANRGEFSPISTAVPGTHICELLPKTALHMDKLALVRSIDTKNGDHGKGSYQMTYGRNRMPGVEYPHIGAVSAKALERSDNPLPGHIRIPGGSRAVRRVVHGWQLRPDR